MASTMIDLVDPTSERDLADAASVLTAYAREVLGPDEPAVPAEEILDGMHVTRDDIEVAALVARDGDRPVGCATVQIQKGHGNEHMAWNEELFVVPDARRRGVGSALLDDVTAIARAAGRSLVLGGHAEGDVAGAAFAARRGATPGNAERQNRVRIADLDRSLLESWNRPADGYSLVQFDGRCPDELIDRLMQIQAVMNDAPRTESLEDSVFTAAQRRASEAELAVAGGTYWFAGARHDATGDLAGFSELSFRPYKPWLVEQEDTGVAPAHRGHGIGRWLKAVNALRVLDEKPDAQLIETWNDGSNRWMLAINDAMGFRPVATWIETELTIS